MRLKAEAGVRADATPRRPFQQANKSVRRLFSATGRRSHPHRQLHCPADPPTDSAKRPAFNEIAGSKTV